MRARGCAAGLSIVLGLACLLSLNGCTAAAYSLGVATMVNDVKVRQRDEYARYRAKAQLSHEKLLTFRQWLRQQGG